MKLNVTDVEREVARVMRGQAWPRSAEFIMPTWRTIAAYKRMCLAGKPPLRATLRRRGMQDTFAMWRRDQAIAERMIKASSGLYALRRPAIRNVGFALICAEIIEHLRPLAPLVEIGAGSGFWTATLKAAGLDVIGTDPCGDDYATAIVHAEHAELQRLTGVEAVRAYPDRNVLCVWPSLGDAWCREAVAAMAHDRTLALVGEWNGCTADEALFEMLSADPWEEIGGFTLPQWPGIHDRLTLHRRKQ